MWDFIDFKTYFLLYFSFFENVQGNSKRAVIRDNVGNLKFDTHMEQILEDKNLISRRKIKKYVNENVITEDQLKELHFLLKEIFLCDKIASKLTKREEDSINTIIRTYLVKSH